MTRIFTDGAEMRDALFWTTPGGVSIADTNPTVFTPGTYYYRNPDSVKSFTALTECYLRYRQYWDGQHANVRAPVFRNAGTELAWLNIDACNRIAVYVSGAGVVATSSFAIRDRQWYIIEIYFKLADAPNGRFEVWVDGYQVINFTGDTKPGAEVDFDNLYWHSYSAIGCDDLAMNDTAGGVDNSWVGDGYITKVTPDEDGAHNNWHGSDGDDIDNFLMVDEYPKDDDTTYVYRDGADAGVQDQYSMSDYVGTNRIISRIWADARTRKTSADGHTIKLGQLAAGGADVVSAARSLTDGVYTRVIGDEALINPVTGIAWVEADIDAIELISEIG